MYEQLTDTERKWGMMCHLSAFAFFIFPFGHILGPLLVWVLRKDQISFVDEQGKEALNFQISITIYSIISALLVIVLIGAALLIGLIILDGVLIVIAGIKASEGNSYRYPFSLRVLK